MANRDVVMRMIGRLSALKASSFVDVDSKEIQKCKHNPSDLEPQNEVGQNVVLLVGNKYNEEYAITGSKEIQQSM